MKVPGISGSDKGHHGWLGNFLDRSKAFGRKQDIGSLQLLFDEMPEEQVPERPKIRLDTGLKVEFERFVRWSGSA